MRLPDFHLYRPLNDLKQRLGLRADEYGSFGVVVTPGGLTVKELEKLATEGIDVDWNEIAFQPDGTPSYKGNRVLLYIRDVWAYEPRYHLATCSTIKEQHSRGRLTARYVVATKPDGRFQVNLSSNEGTRKEFLKLKVCKNCLNELSFDGFREMSRTSRERFVAEFTPAQFFAKYPQSLHRLVPLHNSDDSPLNNYTADFSDVSRKAREEARWRCSACLADLSPPELRKYLHTHHRDGNRGDNRPSNLRVVCIRCHSREPSHSHLENCADYQAYCLLRPATRIG